MDEDDYRQLAEKAKREAERATDPDDRIAWLRAAANWLKRIGRPQRQLQQQPQHRLGDDQKKDGE